MDIDYIALVSRWLHILAAITAVGGTIFIRMALVPSLGVLPDQAKKDLHEAVRGRWAKFVMAAIAFLLLSGLYNIGMIEYQKKVPTDLRMLYRVLFTIKFLLALTIFFVASALVGRSAAFEKIRKNARFWLSFNLVLAIILVCVSGFLRAIRDKPAPGPAVGMGPGCHDHACVGMWRPAPGAPSLPMTCVGMAPHRRQGKVADG